MGEALSLSVIMPAYDEAVRLPSSVGSVVDYLDGKPWDWELRIVDDGSTDETLAIARDWAGRYPRVVAQAEPHRGKGGSVRAGMLASSSALRLICDVDLSMPVEHIDRFMPPVLDVVDVAIGSRNVKGAERIGEPLQRKVMSRAFNLVVRALAVRGLSDTQCGFKMFSAAAAELVFRRVTIDGWAFDVELLTIARRHGLSIQEVPIRWDYAERSRISPMRDSLRMFTEVLRIRRNVRAGLYDD